MFSESNADGESIPGGCCPNRRADEANATIASLQARVDEVESANLNESMSDIWAIVQEFAPDGQSSYRDIINAVESTVRHLQLARIDFGRKHGTFKTTPTPDLKGMWWQAFLVALADGESSWQAAINWADAAIAAYQDKFEVKP